MQVDQLTPEMLPARIASKIQVNDDGCWLWTASINNFGYARLRDGKRIRAAHRVVYELLVAVVPKCLDMDHLCRVRSCVNPLHLEPVTRQENLLRGAASPGGYARWMRAREAAGV